MVEASVSNVVVSKQKLINLKSIESSEHIFQYEARNEIAFYSYGSSESKMRLYLWCKFLRSSQCILIDKFQRCTCVHVVVVNHGFLFGLVVIQSFVNVQFFIKVKYFYFS